jgi:hypothetical protein
MRDGLCYNDNVGAEAFCASKFLQYIYYNYKEFNMKMFKKLNIALFALLLGFQAMNIVAMEDEDYGDELNHMMEDVDDNDGGEA